MSHRVVVVAGGGRGIGRAICERFARDESQVVAAARTVAELEQTRAAIEAEGGKCFVHATDVCASDEVEGLIDTVVKKFGRIDVLVNSAGVAPQSLLGDLDNALFRTIMSVNVDAVFHSCHAVWPVMQRQNGGTIINISSIASIDPFTGFSAYGAAKAWVNAWSKALADEGRPLGIRVFAVAPGAVETRMLRDNFPEFPREATLAPADVAEMVFTLAQPSCQYATGQTVFVRK